MRPDDGVPCPPPVAMPPVRAPEDPRVPGTTEDDDADPDL